MLAGLADPRRLRRPARRASPGCRWSSASTTTRSPRPTASRWCRWSPTAASSSTATARCSRPTTRRTRSRSRPAGCANVERAIDELAEVIEVSAARPPALQEAAGGEQELREPADPHPPHRGGGRALRGEPLPLPRLRDQGAALPLLSAGRGRLARDRLHRPHQRRRREAHRRRRASPPTTRAPTTSASSASRAPTRRSCTALTGTRAGRDRRRRARHPRARRATSRSRATTSS